MAGEPDSTANERDHAAAIEAISQRHEKVQQAQTWYDATKLTLLTLVAVLCSIILVIVVVTQQTLADNSVVNRQNTTRLVDCTTPGHACYDQSAARSRDLIAELIRHDIAAEYCQGRLPATATLEAFRKCVSTEQEKLK